MKDVRVRGAREGEAGQIAALLVSALGDKYRPALGRDAKGALERLIADEVRSGARYLVVADHIGVLGTVHLSTSEDGRGAAGALRRELGPLGALRAIVAWSLMEPGRIHADVAYVDELAVAARGRRRGVARHLLDACEREARAMGKRRLMLLVVWENEAAIALYRKEGFTVTRRRRFRLARAVFGSRGADVMAKPVAQRA